MKEAKRVLRRGGTVITSTVLPSNISHSLWYAQLNMTLTDRFNKIMPCLEQLERMFDESNLCIKQKLNILGADFLKDYHNYEGPLDQAWRDVVSYWSFATPEELNDVKQKVLELKEAGELETWCKEHDHVLHHLDSSGNGDFTVATQTLKEARRVLGPSGTIIISTTLPTTLSSAVWCSQLNMDITDRFNKIMPSMEQFEAMFEESQLHCLQKMNILGSDLVKDYYNFEGPLDENWRGVASYWKYATPEDIDVVKQKVMDLKEAGELEQWAKKHDHVNTSGMLTVLHLLDTGSTDDFPQDFPKVRETLKEAQRVTTSGGGLILILTCLPSTISNEMWMTHLNEDLTVRFNKNNPSIEQFDSMFKANGIKCMQKMNILGTISKQYFNFEGPLHEGWRKTSSYWQLATEKELEQVKQKILELKSKGQLETWARERDHSDTSGILTLLICKRK